MRRLVGILILMMAACGLRAQVQVFSEAQVTASGGRHTPLWLNANKYGLSSLSRDNGYVRAGMFRSIDSDSLQQWAWGGGVDLAVATGFTSTLVVQQAYGELRWKKGLLTVGSKEEPMELRDMALSSGAQTLGINARPVPGIRLSLPDYWEVPGLRGWLALKGHLFYGMTTDDAWQKDFTQGKSKLTERTKIHTKAGYLRLGRADGRLNVELGLEMACQFGGTAYMFGIDGMATENEDGLKGMIHAFVPVSGDKVETVYRNTDGNHLGSWLLRANLDYDAWGISAYVDHFFEDQSSMFLLDYDGYGSGEEWNEKKDARFFMYDLKDAMVGLELRLKQTSWLDKVVVEYLYSKYQCGPLYHDHTQRWSDHVSGMDDYYNHYIFNGWQHWGQVMGNPLYRSPLYNDDGRIHVSDNRFWAWHVGMSGRLLKGLGYRLLCTLQRGWGTYREPFLAPRRNVSALAETRYAFSDVSSLAGWRVKCALGWDSGELLGDNFGVQLTVGKHFNIGGK